MLCKYFPSAVKCCKVMQVVSQTVIFHLKYSYNISLACTCIEKCVSKDFVSKQCIHLKLLNPYKSFLNCPKQYFTIKYSFDVVLVDKKYSIKTV